MNHYHPGGGYIPPGSGMPPPYYPYPPVNPYKRPVRRNANIVGAGLVIVTAIMFLVPSVLGFFAGLLLPQSTLAAHYNLISEIISAIGYIAAFATGCFLMVYWIRIPPHIAFPMRRPRFSIVFPAIFLCLGANILGGICSNILSAVLESTLGIVPTMWDSPVPHGIPETAVYFFAMAVAPAILEEMMFRGVVLQSLRRFGDGFALIVSSILFSFCHGNLIQGPPALFVGLALGYFALRTGSLIPGMIIHFVNNGISAVLTIVTETFTDSQYMMLNGIVMAVYLGTGLVALIYLLLRHSNMFRVMPSDYPLAEGEKHFLFHTSLMPIIYFVITVCITALYLE